MQLTLESVIEELRQDGITRDTVVNRFGDMSDEDKIETIWQCIQVIYGTATATDMLESYTEAVLGG